MKRNFLNFRVFALALALSAGLTACGDDGEDEVKDTQRPVIALDAPANGQHYTRGGAIVLMGTASDDVALKDLQITLSNLKVATGVDDPWTPPTHIVNLQGLKSFDLDNIAAFGSIPSDIWSGNYTLTFKVSDMKGNSTAASVTVSIE